MKKSIITLFLSLLLAFQVNAQEPDCYVQDSPSITKMVCFHDNLETAFDSLNIQWTFPMPHYAYRAVTFAKALPDGVNVSATVFRREVLLDTIAHEVAHLAEFLNLSGEEHAWFIGNHTADILYLMYLEDVPVYLLENQERVYLKYRREYDRRE